MRLLIFWASRLFGYSLQDRPRGSRRTPPCLAILCSPLPSRHPETGLVWLFCAVRCHRLFARPVHVVNRHPFRGHFMHATAKPWSFCAVRCHFKLTIVPLFGHSMQFVARVPHRVADPSYNRCMPEPSDSSVDSTRITVSREVRDSLKTAFPSLTFDEAVSWLLSRYRDSVGDSAAVAGTELWIKLDRLEEACSLLALTNIDIADGFRRQVSGELDVVRASAVRLATIAAAHDQTGGPR